MKTAMQQAIEYLKSFNLQGTAIILEDKFLEKEKEQIIDAYRIAAINNTDKQKWPNLDNKYFEICANEYFEKHFNQNK
jgi:hypothetical protein